MTTLSVEFGYYPYEWEETVGPIAIGTLPTLDAIIAELNALDRTYKDWIYSVTTPFRPLTTDRSPEALWLTPKEHCRDDGCKPAA